MSKAITLVVEGVEITPVGILFPPGLPYEKWCGIGPMAGDVERAMRLGLGDWLNYGQQEYGEKYSQAINDTGFEYGYLANLAWICRRFPISRRRETIRSISIYQALAPLDAEEQETWLDLIEANGWTRTELRAALKEEKMIASGTTEPEMMSPKDIAEGFDYLHRQWRELWSWLDEQGILDKDATGHPLSLKERVELLVERQP